MIDPLVLSDRTAALSRAECTPAQPALDAAAPNQKTDEMAIYRRVHAAHGPLDRPHNGTHEAASSGNVPVESGHGQRPKGQAARAAAYPATRGWR